MLKPSGKLCAMQQGRPARPSTAEIEAERVADATSGPSAEEYHRVLMGLMASSQRQAALQVS